MRLLPPFLQGRTSFYLLITVPQPPVADLYHCVSSDLATPLCSHSFSLCPPRHVADRPISFELPLFDVDIVLTYADCGSLQT